MLRSITTEKESLCTYMQHRKKLKFLCTLRQFFLHNLIITISFAHHSRCFSMRFLSSLPAAAAENKGSRKKFISYSRDSTNAPCECLHVQD